MMITKNKKNVEAMFDRIAKRYDLLNHLLSFGQDIRWRHNAIRQLDAQHNFDVLDLATGTADTLIAITKSSDRIARAVGVDLSEEMLEVGRYKVAAKNLNQKIELIKGDATELPFEDNSFDAVTITFGIRNVENLGKVLREIYRVLRPGGKVIILEFSLPENALIKMVYLAYFRYALPVVGGILSGDFEAYRYLNKTVESFPYGEDFLRKMGDAKLEKAKAIGLTFGIATIYVASKGGSL